MWRRWSTRSQYWNHGKINEVGVGSLDFYRKGKILRIPGRPSLIPNYLLDKFGGLNFLLRCNYDKKVSRDDQFTPVLELKTSYNEFLSHQEFVLFNNKDILLVGCSIFYKTWLDKGGYLIQDLLDVDGKVMSYPEFTKKYLLSCNFLTHFQVTSAVPKNLIESAMVWYGMVYFI